MIGKGEDKITLTILDDGTAKMEVDGISGANHAQAERMVKEMSNLLGGPLQIKKQKGMRQHSHTQQKEKQR